MHLKTYKTERPVNSASISPIRDHVRIFFLCLAYMTEILAAEKLFFCKISFNFCNIFATKWGGV